MIICIAPVQSGREWACPHLRTSSADSGRGNPRESNRIVLSFTTSDEAPGQVIGKRTLHLEASVQQQAQLSYCCEVAALHSPHRLAWLHRRAVERPYTRCTPEAVAAPAHNTKPKQGRTKRPPARVCLRTHAHTPDAAVSKTQRHHTLHQRGAPRQHVTVTVAAAAAPIA